MGRKANSFPIDKPGTTSSFHIYLILDSLIHPINQPQVASLNTIDKSFRMLPSMAAPFEAQLDSPCQLQLNSPSVLSHVVKNSPREPWRETLL